MLVLALDTTTRRGSVALARDGSVLDCEIGDPALTHGERLPGDLLRLLERQRTRVADIDRFAVAAGPGSFTGLRIGIAAMQGLALTNGKPLIGISALEALNAAVRSALSLQPLALSALVGAWIDAQRGEVFSALYRANDLLDGPSVNTPVETLARWKTLKPGAAITFVGDGASAYATLIFAEMPGAAVEPEVPVIAPAVALLATTAAPAAPDEIRPIYIRRPDAELARDRRAATVEIRTPKA